MYDVNPLLSSDYRFFEPYTDPAKSTMITSINMFRSRNYYELELSSINIYQFLSTTLNGTLNIVFPTTGENPYMTFNNGDKYTLRRSANVFSSELSSNLFFRNYSELGNTAGNADVASVSGASQYAYVSMYIIVEGMNPVNFSRIYSKPVHINVFLIPD